MANTLTGNSGANILNSSLGNDKLTGGTGKDTFVFDSILNAAANRDTIIDFNVVNDTVRFDKTVFSKLTTGVLVAGYFRSSAAGTAADGNDYILYNSSTGALFYDADGSGAGVKAIQVVHPHRGLPTITAADFGVIA